MIPMALAFAAAEKTAEASYAIYLWCAGGAAVVGGGGYWYYSEKSSARSENDIEVDVELGLQQQQPLEFAADTLLNVDEQTQTVLIQQAEHLEVLSDSIHQFNETLLHADDSTAQIKQLIQPLHETAMYAEETVQTLALKLKHSEEERASVIHELQKIQSALQEKELQLLDAMGQLTTSQEQLTVTAITTSRQLKHLSGQHQTAVHLAYPNMDLREQTHIEALKKTIEEQARLLLELSDENDILQERISAHPIGHLNPDSTQQPRGSAFTMFGSGR